jgi:hypothetical protein
MGADTGTNRRHVMSVLQITLTRDGPRVATDPGSGRVGVEGAVRAALAHLPQRAPVVVLIHGRGYRPGHTAACPHRLLFSDRAQGSGERFMSWPRRLGIAAQGALQDRGLAIGLGWDSRGDIWTATRAADRAAADLAGLVTLLRRLAPDRPVDLVGHSLGVRVMMGALPRLHAGAVGRMILLAGAEFADRARAALTTPAGHAAEVINITSRENDLFDWLFETALAPLGRGRALGVGLGDLPNAVDVQIDGRAARRNLARLGFRLAEPRLRVCHWSVYLRPGVFPFYRALLNRRTELTLPVLRAALTTAPEPRWARLGSRARPAQPLPFPGPGPTLPA